MKDIWIPLAPHLIAMGDRLGIIVDEDLVHKAVRQYLHHIKKTRKYKLRMRTDPKTRDEWYTKRRIRGRIYRASRREFLEDVAGHGAARQGKARAPMGQIRRR